MRIPETLAPLAVPIGDLHPYERNPRRGDVATIVRSLELNGQYRPIVARAGTNEVLAGNHTLLAALELGWEEIAATFVEVDDEQAARIVLVDNRANDLAGDELASLLQSQPSLDGTGWQPQELDRLLASLEREKGDDGDTDPAEPPAKPKARPGDLYVLGEQRLLCGDSTDPDDVARLLAGAEPQLLVTDPPYGVELDMEWRDRAGLNVHGPAEQSYLRTAGHRNTTISSDTKADWSDAFELVPSLRIAYVWHASKYAIEVGLGLRRIGFELAQMIVWDKQLFAISRSHYHWQHEPCWYARRPGGPRWRGGSEQTTVWSVRSPKMIMAGSGEEKVDHPTQKPLELYLRPLRNHLTRGGAFYEPFGGSGTALIAAENLGRRCYAMEIDPRFVDVIVDRWQRHTGREAELERPRRRAHAAV